MSFLDKVTEASAFVGHRWLQFKAWLELGPIDGQALHVVCGLLLLLAFAAVFRRPLASWLPWLAVLTLEIANEWTDIALTTGPGIEGPAYADSVLDAALTIAMPTVLLLISRKRPRILAR